MVFEMQKLHLFDINLARTKTNLVQVEHKYDLCYFNVWFERNMCHGLIALVALLFHFKRRLSPKIISSEHFKSAKLLELKMGKKWVGTWLHTFDLILLVSIQIIVLLLFEFFICLIICLSKSCHTIIFLFVFNIPT